jgi:3-oxoacyl-[acyl-carrier protein] reductase|tara:strand:- start:12199 stop:12933 length:735 start_codon:yes stop_codon:yes gene_type:complete
MDLRITEKRTVITGAAQGIGAAIAKGFAEEGASLLLIDMNDSVVELAKHLGAKSLVCNLSDPESARAVAEAGAELGGADILVNNAGISRPSPLPETTDEEWSAVLDINLSAAFRVTRALWEQLSENGGVIVNLASFASKRSTLFGNNSSYVAAKHGIAGLTRAAAFEGATQNIRVNAIAPGVVETDLIRSVHDADARAKIMGFIPQARFAEPSEIADLALFLASDRSRHICGEVVNINGGLCMD